MNIFKYHNVLAFKFDNCIGILSLCDCTKDALLSRHPAGHKHHEKRKEKDEQLAPHQKVNKGENCQNQL